MNLQNKRLISQIILFFSANLGALGLKTGFCYPFFYCNACPAATSACPLRALERSVFQGSLNWRLFFYPLLIIGSIGIISGRAVCGWVCPIGFLQRGTGKVARKLKKYEKVKKIGQLKIERYLRYIKYIVLLGLVIATPFLIGFMFTDICPVGFLTGTIPIMILKPGLFVPSHYFWIALVIFVLFLILIFTIERGWCRYFCPVGALLSPFNKISYIHVDVETKACIHCHLCSNICPMGINIPEMHRDPECILCGKCVDVCPRLLIKIKRGNK